MKKLVLTAIFLLAATIGWSQSIHIQKPSREKGVEVKMATTHGKITMLLYEDTPIHMKNFIKLAEDGVYDGLLFHRVIKGFMIQAGDPLSRDAQPGQMLGNGTVGYTLPAEILPNHFHKRGALCAARMGDNVNPHRESSGSQFYIVQGNVWNEADLDAMQARAGKKFSPEQRKVYTTIGGAPHLDGEYTVFGEVLDGMDVVDRIAGLKRDKFDRPFEDVRILSIKVSR